MQIKEVLGRLLTDTEMEAMIWSYDRIGDILITIIPESLKKKESLIGEALLRAHPSIRVIGKRTGIHQGEFRTRGLQIIAGENRKETLHKENGILLYLNPETVYYSVRMAGERLRLANLIQPEERIAVLCSGVGPFPLTMAKHSKARLIVGIEKNPVAHSFALKNIQLNKMKKRVRFYRGDATQILPALPRQFDRIVTVLPTADPSMFVNLCLPSLAAKGTLHHYAMVNQGDKQTVKKQIIRTCNEHAKKISTITSHRCGHCGPRTDRFCFTVRFS
ncbi:methyltransferase [Desulfogranum marinum]|uniref:class I SAM-dependent methyltransferase n=1 Tax=Desulfogranum marinum TaxID=453220 RepID=UPI0029C7605E|nr:methyltransferase [Desulfogranum marinum]